MKATVQHVTFPDNRRILMISDIHGHAEGLRALLEQAQFTPDDILVIVGDLVEKGPDSLGTVRMVMELCRTHTVYPLMGNVDLWRLSRILSDDPAMRQHILDYSLKARKWWNTSFLDELCREIGVVPDETMDTETVFRQLKEHFSSEFDFLLSLPTILETQRMIFVHGGIPHQRVDELAGTDVMPLMKWDAFRDTGLSFQKYVASGHWPVYLYEGHQTCGNPIIDPVRKLISLDGGCGLTADGQLNLVIQPSWDSDDFSFLSWNDLPTITALDAQPASAAYSAIRWGREDEVVTVMEQQDDWARVLYKTREMIVPSDFLFAKGDVTCCEDITDYRLAVSPGDRLSLVLKRSFGCYVKKEGVTGWYKGRYTE